MIKGSRVEWVSCDVMSDATPAVADSRRHETTGLSQLFAVHLSHRMLIARFPVIVDRSPPLAYSLVSLTLICSLITRFKSAFWSQTSFENLHKLNLLKLLVWVCYERFYSYHMLITSVVLWTVDLAVQQLPTKRS